MPEDSPVVLIVGLGRIAAAAGMGVKTLKRMIRDHGFPAARYDDNRYRSNPDDIAEWNRQRLKNPVNPP